MLLRDSLTFGERVDVVPAAPGEIPLEGNVCYPNSLGEELIMFLLKGVDKCFYMMSNHLS